MSPRRRSIHAPIASIFAPVALVLLAISPALAQQQGTAPRPRTTQPATGQPKAKTSAPPARAVEDPARVRKMDELLAQWAAHCKTLESLSVRYTRIDNDPVFDVKKEYVGQAHFRRKDLIYLDFNEVKDGASKPVFDERIVCDGGKIYQFVGKTKQIFVYPLPKEAQAKALNQGALPFLFDMNVANAKQRYKMIFRDETKTAYQIQVIPLLEIDREEYLQAMVQLSKETFLPERIMLLSNNGKETKSFSIAPGDMITNRDIPSTWFDGEGMAASMVKKSGWKRIDNPEQPTAQPQPAAALGARPPAGAAGAAARPATKGQGGGLRQR